MEKVAHRIDENPGGDLPGEWLFEPLWVANDVFSFIPPGPGLLGPAKLQADPLGVAVGASIGYLAASRGGIPAFLGP